MEETKMIEVYTKECLCVIKDWPKVQAKLAGYEVKTRRTALNPLWHELAKKAWGADNYPPFVLLESGITISFKELIEGEIIDGQDFAPKQKEEKKNVNKSQRKRRSR